MHVPNALTLVQRTGTYSPTLDTLRASYDQTILTTTDEYNGKITILEDSDERRYLLRVHHPKATNLLCQTTHLLS